MASFTFLTSGEFHGPQLTVIVTGMPAGVRLDRERIHFDLKRRQHGYGRVGAHRRSRLMRRRSRRGSRWGTLGSLILR
jgi:chorismate synthase